MAETATAETTTQSAVAEQSTATETETASTETAPTTEAEQSLGDAGKKALDAMKAKWKEAEAKAKTEADERAALQAKLDGKEAEHAKAQEAQKIRDEALNAANQRILKAEIRAAAAGKLADPTDALQFIDLSALEVGADGDVDATAISALIDNLVKAKPYLAAQGKRFEGGADGGARNESPGVSIEERIAEAQKARDFQLVIRLKNEQAQALKSKS